MATRSLDSPGPHDEITTDVLDAVEHSLWRRYNDLVVGDFMARRLEEPRAVILKTDVFEEALGNDWYPRIMSGALVGMDVSRVVLGQARQRTPRLPLVRADVRRLPFADGTVAGILSTSTLDHFRDARDLDRSMREIARVLKPGGQLLLTLDNPCHPLLALRNAIPNRLRMGLKLTPYFVGRSYDPDQIVGVLEGLGFQVREVGALLHVPRTLVRLWGVFSRKAGLTGLDQSLLRWLARIEVLANCRTRWLTGQYVAVKAVRSG